MHGCGPRKVDLEFLHVGWKSSGYLCGDKCIPHVPAIWTLIKTLNFVNDSGSEHFQARMYRTSLRLFEASMLYLDARDSDSCMLQAKSLRVLCLCHLALSQFERAAEVIEQAEKVNWHCQPILDLAERYLSYVVHSDDRWPKHGTDYGYVNVLIKVHLLCNENTFLKVWRRDPKLRYLARIIEVHAACRNQFPCGSRKS